MDANGVDAPVCSWNVRSRRDSRRWRAGGALGAVRTCRCPFAGCPSDPHIRCGTDSSSPRVYVEQRETHPVPLQSSNRHDAGDDSV
jgi:hypothetical protein